MVDSYDLGSNTKFGQNKIMNKMTSTYFKLGHGMEMGEACDKNN